MSDPELREKRRRNLMAKALKNKGDKEFRLRVIDNKKGRSYRKLRPIDILNTDPEDLEDFE